jgi:hypothetical protein
VWLAAFAGIVLARFDWSRWHLPPRWRPPLVGWALVIAVSWPIVAGREVDFSLVAARTLTTTNAAFAAPPPVAAAFVVIVALAQMLGILWMDLLWARSAQSEGGPASPPFDSAQGGPEPVEGPKLAGIARSDGGFERLVALPLAAGTAVSCLVGIYQATVDLTWMNAHTWASVNRAGGLTNDANSLGTGAALWAPIAVVLAWRAGKTAWLGFVAFLVFAAGMWASGSRTALLTFAVGSIGLGIAMLKQRGLWQPRIGRMIALVAAACFILAMAVVPRNYVSSNPLQRAFSRVPRLEADEIKRFATELWNRFEYGEAAAEIFREHPITGIGIGAFHVVGTDYIYRDTNRQIPADNAQNWWRHQVVELGLVGALPSLWFSLIVMALLRGDDDPPAEVTVLRGVVVGVGLASLVGVPTQYPGTWLSFVSLVFWLSTFIASPQIDRAAPIDRWRWTGVWIVVTIVAVGLAVTARGDLRVVQRALRAGLPYAYGLSGPEGLSAYGDMHRVARDAVSVVAVRHRWLQLTMWPQDADVSSDPVTARVSLDGKEVLQHRFADREPVVYLLEIPQAQFVVLESHVSGQLRGAWALQLAVAWHREIPPDAPPEHVVRLRRN